MKYKIKRKQNNSNYCVVCGVSNPLSLNASFYDCDDNILIGVFHPHKLVQSYPNRMHGGIISAILDESIGRVIQVVDENLWAVTMNLTVNFRLPVPLDDILYTKSIITKQTHRYYEGISQLYSKDGKLLADASGKFLLLPPEKIDTEAISEENWFNVKDDGILTEIEF